tara:strand:+ start:451 stop:927 length:477 start_codon:yes stop_codon:yes gene_type:complete
MRVVSGIEVTTVSTTAQFPVGEKFMVSQPASDLPPAIWMYVKADSTLAIGDVCSWVASATGTAYVIPAPYDAAVGLQSTANIAGVAQHVIASGSYGFIQIGGVGEVKTAGSVAVNTCLAYPDTAVGVAETNATEGFATFGIVLVAEATPQKSLITLAR